ncbi:MAG: DUF4230 domain-containing protein [Prevotella sp.]|nr:DUF4230 domain-containing protein [Prevotella sp.]
MNKTLSIVTILVLAAIAAFIFFMTFRTGDIDHKVWPVTINQLSKTEKLKIITFHKEILVGEHRISKGLFSNNEDKIYVVYPATLNIGFDLSKCDENTFRRVGEDTVVVTLPPVEVLNKDGMLIDEAGKHTAIEKGIWGDDVVSNLGKRAQAIMLRSCEYDSCYKKAEQLGAMMVRTMVGNLGFSNVVVNVKKRSNNGLALVGEKYGSSTPFKFYRADGRRFLLCRAKGKATQAKLYYPGGTFTYPQLLALGDFFQMHHQEVKSDVELRRKGDTLIVKLVHDYVVEGSKEAVAIVRNVKSKDAEIWIKGVQRDIFQNKLRLTLQHVDKNGKVIYTYP